MYLRGARPVADIICSPVCAQLPEPLWHSHTHLHTPGCVQTLACTVTCPHTQRSVCIQTYMHAHRSRCVHTHLQKHTHTQAITHNHHFHTQGDTICTDPLSCLQIHSLLSPTHTQLDSYCHTETYPLTVTWRLLRQHFCLAFPESGCRRSLEWILEYQVTGLQSPLCHGAPGATHSHYVPEPHLLDPTGLDRVTELSWLPGPQLLLCKS